MPNERTILCGSTERLEESAETEAVQLRMWGPDANVHLSIEDVARGMFEEIPDRYLDLIDIATYVYCADQAITRANGGRVDGSDAAPEIGEGWRRTLRFCIPVREPDRWRSPEHLGPLVSTLSILSDDEYHFEFEPLRNAPPAPNYLRFGGTQYDGMIDEVMLFSGGLDSLAGAVQEAVVDRRRVLLVNHRSTEKLTPRHAQLLSLLDGRAGDRRPFHLPVRVNKAKRLGREYTQRSRSFLYASLAATVASMIGLSRLRFYENGVVSLNLPLSAQVVGARATRTTHPQVLNGFARLFSALTGRPFEVENPFVWKTKTDVVNVIGEAGCGQLVGHSTSCTHTWEITKEHSHCGQCSQCIDRRFAILAAGLEAHDPAKAYGVDLLVGERSEGTSKVLLAAYLETANEVNSTAPAAFFTRFGEAARVVRQFPGSADATAARIFQLYKRHAEQVTRVIDRAIKTHAAKIRARTLPPTCLLRLVCDASTSTGVAPTGSGQPDQLTDARPRNYICRRNLAWAIRFDGQLEQVYLPEVGFEYLRILLGSPGTMFTAAALACDVRRGRGAARRRAMAEQAQVHELNGSVDGQDADDMLDAEAREAIATRLAEIDELLERLRAGTSPTRLDEIEELEKERSRGAAELRSARGLRGRSRALASGRDRVRNRVCNAIKRALKQIGQFDRRLADHLSRPVLSFGNDLRYFPRQETIWTVDA
jgi:hypothetical protein